MHFYPKTLITTSMLLLAFSSIAQEPYHSTDANLMARLSYDNSGIAVRGNVTHVCLAVFRDGDYLIVRSWDDGQTQRLQGKLSKEEFRQLSKLLEADDFRILSGNHGGPIRREAESFAAEIPLGDRWRADGTRKWLEHEAWRLRWLNADGESPFPDSVSKLVDWLRHFQPKDGKSFEYGNYPDVCPVEGLRLLAAVCS